MKIQQIETAINSFHAHHSKSAVQHQIILDFLSAGGDYSINELAKALGMGNNVVSGRLNELLKLKLIVECEHRKDRYSNVMCRPVALKKTQLELFH
jgi:predicted transcriptional regulator